jgi:DNA-binding CsgD family transcriptional regulator/PAS domain-containing protein
MRSDAEEHLDRASVLEALHEIALAVGATTDPDALAGLVGRHARALLRADDVTVYLWDEAAALLRLVFGEDTGHELFPTMAPGEGAIGRAFDSGEPEVVTDYQNWEGALPSILERGIQRMAAVPLKVGSRSIGVLAVRFLGNRGCAPAQIEALQLLAAPVAGILDAAVARQRAEADRALLATIVDVLPCGVIVRDVGGLIMLINEAGRRIIGVGPTEAPPTHFDQFDGLQMWDPATNRLLPQDERPTARALNGQAVLDYEVRVRLPGAAEDAWMRVSTVPMYDAHHGISGAVATFSDISPERELWHTVHASARENSRLLADLQEAQRRHQQLLLSLVPPAAALAAADKLAGRLSAREREVLVHLARGETNRRIGAALGLSAGTIKKHVEHILAKLGVGDRTQAAVRASELGLTERPR